VFFFHVNSTIILLGSESNIFQNTCFTAINSLAPGGFRDFRKKYRLNARGFAWEFLWSGMLYRPGKSLKRCGKSSSLHSKKFFCLGVAGFLWVMS